MAAERGVTLRTVREYHLHMVTGTVVDPNLDLSRTSELLVRDDEAVFGQRS